MILAAGPSTSVVVLVPFGGELRTHNTTRLASEITSKPVHSAMACTRAVSNRIPCSQFVQALRSTLHPPQARSTSAVSLSTSTLAHSAAFRASALRRQSRATGRTRWRSDTGSSGPWRPSLRHRSCQVPRHTVSRGRSTRWYPRSRRRCQTRPALTNAAGSLDSQATPKYLIEEYYSASSCA